MKIIHCLWDDKFMDGTIRVYECDKRHSNAYVIVTKDPQHYKFQYIKSPQVRVISLSDFNTKVKDYDVVVLHSFACLENKVISNIPSNCKVIWYSWGFDTYNGLFPIIPIQLYNNETKEYIRNHCKKRKIKDFLYALKEHLYFKKALSRIDYYSGVFPYEHDLIKQYHPFFNAKKLDFYYGDTDFFIKESVSHNIERNKYNIILGNSADPCNNHHDALTYLSQIRLPEEAKIIIPLSYAGNKEYRDWVNNYAESLFPGKVIPLIDYLPLEVYINLVSCCKVAIFFHERQQASDNIFMQMLYGAKVFLSETSYAYKYLKKEGYVVFSLQSDYQELYSELSDDELIHNRNLLAKNYSESTILSRVRSINDVVSGKVNNYD